MAITRGATISSYVRSASGTDASVSHTVDVGTSLLVITTMYEAAQSVTALPTWSEGGTFVLVDQVGTGLGADAALSTYAMVSPPAGAGTITVTHSSNDNAITVAVNYLGTETSTVGEAIQFIAEDDNNATITNTSTFSSAGTSGNTLYAAGCFRGADGDGITVPTNFSEIFDADTGGGSNTADNSGYVCDYIEGAPSACSWTWAATDENVAHYLEIVPAAASTTPFYYRRHIGFSYG